jgi:hypothetical protein
MIKVSLTAASSPGPTANGVQGAPEGPLPKVTFGGDL